MAALVGAAGALAVAILRLIAGRGPAGDKAQLSSVQAMGEVVRALEIQNGLQQKQIDALRAELLVLHAWMHRLPELIRTDCDRYLECPVLEAEWPAG